MHPLLVPPPGFLPPRPPAPPRPRRPFPPRRSRRGHRPVRGTWCTDIRTGSSRGDASAYKDTIHSKEWVPGYGNGSSGVLRRQFVAKG